MYKVLIVDDEPLFLDYLRTVLNWESLGFVICGEARNGQKALELAEKTFPDVVLVDINMPNMDGMELSQRLKQNDPDMAIVMVTGNAEFQYARDALRIGVVEYILKPFDPDELFLTMIKIKSYLQRTREYRQRDRDHILWLREQFLNMLISTNLSISDADIRGQMERFGIPAKSGRYAVITVEIDHLYKRWSDHKEILLWKNTVSNLLHEIIAWPGQNIVFFGPEDRIVSLFQLTPDYPDPTGETESLQRLCDMVKRHFKFSVTVGVGNLLFGNTGIRASYMESMAALQSKIILGTGGVIRYQDSDRTPHGFYSSEVNEKMMLALRLKDEDEMKQLLEEVFRYIREQRLSAEMTYVTVFGLVSICLSHIVASGKDIGTVLGGGFSPYQELKQQETLEKTYQWVEEISLKTLNMNNDDNKPSRSRKIFEEAKLLIEQHYRDPGFNVEEITKQIFINGSYLRKIFHKEAFMSVSDYITHTRMQHAKELILRRMASVTEIAEMTGYSNPGYFSKCFKKHVGVTPSEYEAQSKIENSANITII
jgi:two-component system response regulator YesN